MSILVITGLFPLRMGYSSYVWTCGMNGMMPLSCQKVEFLTNLGHLPGPMDSLICCTYLAYGVSRTIISPFRGQQLTPADKEFSKAMSAAHFSVEWTFGKIIQQFAFLDFRKNLKILLQPVGKYYFVGTLLTNCHTCLYGSQTSTFFCVSHPTSLDV